jgi:hypothetical protein
VSNNSKPSLLVILSRFPYPLEKGDKLRAYHQLLGLSKQFELILICTTDQPISQDHFQKVKSISNSKSNIKVKVKKSLI